MRLCTNDSRCTIHMRTRDCRTFRVVAVDCERRTTSAATAAAELLSRNAASSPLLLFIRSRRMHRCRVRIRKRNVSYCLFFVRKQNVLVRNCNRFDGHRKRKVTVSHFQMGFSDDSENAAGVTDSRAPRR